MSAVRQFVVAVSGRKVLFQNVILVMELECLELLYAPSQKLLKAQKENKFIIIRPLLKYFFIPKTTIHYLVAATEHSGNWSVVRYATVLLDANILYLFMTQSYYCLCNYRRVKRKQDIQLHGLGCLSPDCGLGTASTGFATLMIRNDIIACFFSFFGHYPVLPTFHQMLLTDLHTNR
jgi:hypothetical protein